MEKNIKAVVSITAVLFTCIRAQSPVTQLRLTLMQMKETMTMVTIMAMVMIDIIVSSMEAVSTMMEVLLCLAVAF